LVSFGKPIIELPFLWINEKINDQENIIKVMDQSSHPNNIPDEEWNRTFGGPYNDIGISVQQTSDGGYIISGYTEFNVSGNLTWDGLVVKTDVNGFKLWEKKYGGIYTEVLVSIKQTSDGGYITTGYTGSYGPGNGSANAWLIKTDKNGSEQWNKTYGGLDYDGGFCVLHTVDEGYIIFGVTSSYGAGGSDFWLIKTYANGTEQWNKTFGGSGYDDSGISMSLCEDGGYILTGRTESNESGDYDALLIKTDVNGTEQWNKTFGGPDYDTSYSVTQTADGGYIMTGNTVSYGNNDSSDVWLIKTDGNGTEQWNKTFGGSNDDVGLSVQQISDEGYVLSGYTSSYGAGDYDVWLIKTDGNGTEQWNKTFGGLESDRGYSFIQTTNEKYVLIGETESFGAGWKDVWLLKVSDENQPPDNPIIDGPTFGMPGIEYSYRTNIIDPEGDSCYCMWDWGDDSYSAWLGPYDSGEVISASHAWSKGGYEIRVKAKDVNGAESNWSDPLIIVIEGEPPIVEIIKPDKALYIMNRKILPRFFRKSLILGSIDVTVEAIDYFSGINRVEFYIDNELKTVDNSSPFIYAWTMDKITFLRHRHTIKVIAFDNAGNSANDEIKVRKFF
ncbi:MAG: hypothetical protein KAV40_01530, partial [Thermoplasmatales archaeon]|nr:hypothetical protein [Thermoplasmatales archaeon]